MAFPGSSYVAQGAQKHDTSHSPADLESHVWLDQEDNLPADVFHLVPSPNGEQENQQNLPPFSSRNRRSQTLRIPESTFQLARDRVNVN
jgi:hypothetical protein